MTYMVLVTEKSHILNERNRIYPFKKQGTQALKKRIWTTFEICSKIGTELYIYIF